MPPAILCAANYSLVTVELPGKGELIAGVLLVDLHTGRLYVRFRRDWNDIAPGNTEVFSQIEEYMKSLADEMGTAKLLEYLEDTLSNTVRISDRQHIMVEDFDRKLAQLYREHVHSRVLPFETHLPKYSLAVAAGPWLENKEIEPEGWVEAPPNVRLTKEMFAVRVTGRSMEPLIPDRSLCIFRRGVVGSRTGKLVLVEALGHGSNDRYTVKRYRSFKTQNPDGTWSHEGICLEPLNPDFDAWYLNPEEDRYRILAEFVQVLD